VQATEVAEIEALRSSFAAAPAELADDLGVASLDVGCGALAVRVSSAPANAYLNHALGISSVEQLETIVTFYGDTAHAVSPEPGADLDAALSERGYEPGGAWMKFSRGGEPAERAPTDLAVADANGNRADDFARAAVEGFGMPGRLADWIAQLPEREGWYCFVAYDGKEPAAAGALYVYGGLAWLGIGATRPAFRRRGAQGAILAARIERAVELGCTLLVTETGERVEGRPSSSYRNILRAGFRETYLRPNWCRVPPTRGARAGRDGR